MVDNSDLRNITVKLLELYGQRLRKQLPIDNFNSVQTL